VASVTGWALIAGVAFSAAAALYNRFAARTRYPHGRLLAQRRRAGSVLE
jgi:hypothetical protein